MNRNIMLLLFTALVQTAVAQVVTFSKTVYHEDESVNATVIGGLQGVENDITKSSLVATDGSVNLGTPTEPGFYSVHFIFSNNKRESYLLIVLPTGETSTDPLVFNLQYADNKKKDDKNIFAQMVKYFDEQPMNVLQIPVYEGVKVFGQKNAVNIVHNVAFCIVMVKSGGIPLATAICKDLSIDNTKKLGKEIFLQVFLDMKNRNYLTADQYNYAKLTVELTDFKNVLQASCSNGLKLLSKVVNDPNLKMAIGYQAQLCKMTEIVIKQAKMP